MLINFTNHPSDKWSSDQMKAARKQYGYVVDYRFPEVPPEAGEQEIKDMAEPYFSMIAAAIDSCANEPHPVAVHIQGEFTLVYRLVSLLKSSGITCVASTTRRIVEEHSDGTRTYKFQFVKFREYV